MRYGVLMSNTQMRRDGEWTGKIVGVGYLRQTRLHTIPSRRREGRECRSRVFGQSPRGVCWYEMIMPPMISCQWSNRVAGRIYYANQEKARSEKERQMRRCNCMVN